MCKFPLRSWNFCIDCSYLWFFSVLIILLHKFVIHLTVNLYQVASQPLAVLVKSQFVPIFAVCMALHCSKRSGWEKGAVVLQSSILHLAEISENERDKLIKKYMVCPWFSDFLVSVFFFIVFLSVDDYVSLGSVACMKSVNLI